jgi:glycosyltransferase involved in cell wall biosynthesis
MAKSKIVIQFICYAPRIYSGFDKFNLELVKVLNSERYKSVFVFTDRIEVQSIIDDLFAEGVMIEIMQAKSKLKKLRYVTKLFVKYKPVVVHAHFENYIQLITAILSLIFGSRYFITFHSTISLLSMSEYIREKGMAKGLLLRLYYKFLIAASSKILCVSNAIKEQFIAFSGSDSSKIQSLYLGVKIHPDIKSKIRIRAALSFTDETVLLCNVSAIEPIKGLNILIKAVWILKMKYNLSNFKCCHIGGLRAENNNNISYREKLFLQVKELQIENEFKWFGQRNDIDEILSAFDIYVHPSRMEGVPVAIMEACAQSLPIVGSRVGGIPEIVKNDQNGFLFLSESPEDLALFLNKLITNSELRKRMGAESLRIVKENFNTIKQTKELVSLMLKH